MKGSNSLMSRLNKSLFQIGGNIYVSDSKNKEAFTMSTAINYQLSIFGKYAIAPSPETITELMPKINRETQMTFLPNLINSQQVEIPSSRINIISNLGFITQDQQYSIAILNDRVDVNYNKVNETSICVEDFYKFATKALSTIIEYSGVASNRLAINIRQVCEMKSFSDLNARGKDLLTCATYYTGKDFAEWAMRTNSQTDIQINESTERLNVITDISSGQDVTGLKAAALFHIDINTLPQNQNMRFSKEALEPFVQSALSIAISLISDVERLIMDE
jgi:hypothetical protein